MTRLIDWASGWVKCHQAIIDTAAVALVLFLATIDLATGTFESSERAPELLAYALLVGQIIPFVFRRRILEDIEATGREALTEMRRLLGVSPKRRRASGCPLTSTLSGRLGATITQHVEAGLPGRARFRLRALVDQFPQR